MKDLLSLDWKRKIRQINYLVILLVQPLLSRNFCKKRVISTLCYYATPARLDWEKIREIKTSL